MFAMLGSLWAMLAAVFKSGHIASHSLDRLSKQAVIKSQVSLDKEVVKYERHLEKLGKSRAELDDSIKDIFADFNIEED